jgi:hypothetical protein
MSLLMERPPILPPGCQRYQPGNQTRQANPRKRVVRFFQVCCHDAGISNLTSWHQRGSRRPFLFISYSPITQKLCYCGSVEMMTVRITQQATGKVWHVKAHTHHITRGLDVCHHDSAIVRGLFTLPYTCTCVTSIRN